MTINHQFQAFGSDLLDQPRDAIWIVVENESEEKAVRNLCARIDGKMGVKAGITGIHASKPKEAFPKHYIIGVSYREHPPL